MIRAGALRERITLESRLETVLPSGAVHLSWIPEQILRAELVQEDAETFLTGTERAEMRNVFRIWAVSWIKADMRLIHDERTYRIVRIVPLDRLALELHCVNAVNEP
jgi:head-tail adaptor